jgi:hypothetical protein
MTYTQWIAGSVALTMLASQNGSVLAADAVTPQSLLAEMSNLARLASTPSPAYTSKQFASNDPQSTSPASPRAWFANKDWDHWHGMIERNGRTERVMMHADGPGALVRIWSANPEGTLRIYIDGDATPVIEAPMDQLLAGKVKGLGEPISGVRGKGYNLYLPIPYAKSCEVTTDHKGFYYHVDYRTYEPGTTVTSFKAGDLERLTGEIDKQQKLLAKPREAGAKADHVSTFDVSIAPGESKTLGRNSGARAITELLFQMPADISEATLRGLVLRITFDGETTVEVPLGDFFGTAPGINSYESLPLGMTKSGELYAHWLMPFRESAVVEVKNLGDVPVAFTGQIGSVDRAWTDDSLHFNAGFRAEANRDAQPPIDWNYLTATGNGRFVGASFTIDNPVKDWWGEGDEKFFVDGESQPSWFGTGTEDYFGYAWGWPGLFRHAYHNQPRCDGPGTYGRTSVNRFHIMDDVPFSKSFKFDMELWHWKQCKVNLSATTYWYAAPGGGDAFAAIGSTDVVVHPMAAYKPWVAAGAIEGETMTVLEHSASSDAQELGELSGDRHLWWRGAKLGDTLVLGFTVEKAGRYQVRGRFVTADDYGIVNLAINGQSAGEAIDFYNPSVAPTPERDLGTFDLVAGQNRLSVAATGTSDKGKHEHMFGLDYLVIAAADRGAVRAK